MQTTKIKKIMKINKRLAELRLKEKDKSLTEKEREEFFSLLEEIRRLTF